MANHADSSHSSRLVVSRGEAGYPLALLELADPPERLFVRGRWPVPGIPVAIVGARAATPYGLELAARLGGSLARLGLTVVSGLAHGIDAAAHRAALAAGGATLAILPGGLDCVVPRGHEPLSRQIAARGALLSEQESGPPRHSGAFLDRNRLIAALARAVVVVEARVKSGALNTAFHARGLGRPVLAVPGDVDRETSRGCHALLRRGARVCEDAADILAAIEEPRAVGSRAGGRECGVLSLALEEPAPGSMAPARAPQEPAAAVRLLEVLSKGPRSAEQCASIGGLAMEEVQALLLELEWAGLVAAVPGGRWRRLSAER